jgi:hypothetical protein
MCRMRKVRPVNRERVAVDVNRGDHLRAVP